jgi:hypothetical protein
MRKIQVSVSRIKDKRTQKERPLKYSDIPDGHDWICAKRYLPISFDLMHLNVKNKPKHVSGWWNGEKWEGLRLRPGDRVIKWKRNISYD